MTAISLQALIRHHSHLSKRMSPVPALIVARSFQASATESIDKVARAPMAASPITLKRATRTLRASLASGLMNRV